MNKSSTYSLETAGELMTTRIPTARQSETVAHVLKRLSNPQWDDVHTIYIVSDEKKLQGRIPLAKILSSTPYTVLGRLMEKADVSITPHTDQEKVVIEAVKNDVKSVPVVDHENIFLGAVTADKIIDVLHEEHLEDFLRSSGISGRGSHILRLVEESIIRLVEARLPWLIVGLLIGLVFSFTTSQFEEILQKNITLVYFMPMIAYMAAAVGTQTETIFIRALTLFKIDIRSYILREVSVGIIMGALIGSLTALFAYVLSQSVQVSIVIGLSIFASMTVAMVLSISIPLLLKKFGKDPAVGGGPFTTAIQDLISLLIYFLTATALLS